MRPRVRVVVHPTVALLRPHLTLDNHEGLLAAASHRTKREVEHQIACLAPRPDAKALIRRLPAPTAEQKPAASIVTAALPSVVALNSTDGTPGVLGLLIDDSAPDATPRPTPRACSDHESDPRGRRRLQAVRATFLQPYVAKYGRGTDGDVRSLVSVHRPRAQIRTQRVSQARPLTER